MLRRRDRHADVDGALAVSDREAAVLGKPFFGDVERAHHLQAPEHRAFHCFRDLRHPPQDAVDPQANDRLVGLSIEMDIGGALADRVTEGSS
jgi:hypothetical protein